VTCEGLGSDLRMVVGPPRELALCSAMAVTINTFCSSRGPTTLGCRSDGADPAQFELYFTSAATCAVEATALSDLARAAYGVNTQLGITCGPNETAIVAGSGSASQSECASLAGGVRFVARSGSSGLAPSICDAAAGVVTTSTVSPTQTMSFFFEQSAAFDAMYTAAVPPTLTALRQNLGITLATAGIAHNAALTYPSSRIDVLTLSSSGRCVIAINPPTTAVDEATTPEIIAALSAVIDNEFAFTFGGHTATTLKLQATVPPTASESDGNDGTLTIIYIVVAVVAVVLIAVVVWTRRRGPTEFAVLDSKLWYDQPSRKDAPQRLSYTNIKGGPAASWTRDIGVYTNKPASDLDRIFPHASDYTTHQYGKSFPLGDGNRSSRDYAVKISALSEVPSHHGALREHHDVVAESLYGAAHFGLAYVDSFHKSRAIAVLSDVFSWDDVWDSTAEIVVTMTAADEECGVHIPGEHHAAQHGPVAATRIGALQVSPSVAVSVISLYHEVTQETRTVRIFRASTWGSPRRLSVFIELLIAAKETVRQFGSADSVIFVHDDSRQVGAPAGALAVAWVSLQSALYTGEVNLPQTLLVMQGVRPGLIVSGADYALVYAALRHLLVCVPAIHGPAATKVDSRMKAAVDAWIDDAEQARAFGEPEPIDDNDAALGGGDGGYLTLQVVEPDQEPMDQVEETGFSGSVSGSEDGVSEDDDSEEDGVSAEFDDFEEEAAMVPAPSERSSPVVIDESSHTATATEVVETDLRNDPSVANSSAQPDAGPNEAPQVAAPEPEPEPEDFANYDVFQARQDQRTSKTQMDLKAKQLAEAQALKLQESAAAAAATAAIEDQRQARKEAQQARDAEEAQRTKAEAEAKHTEKFGFFEETATVQARPRAFSTFQAEAAEKKHEAAEATLKQEEESAAQEADAQKRDAEALAEAQQQNEIDTNREIEEEKAAKAAAAREAYRNRRRGSVQTFDGEE
jgi:hypothetical protein